MCERGAAERAAGEGWRRRGGKRAYCAVERRDAPGIPLRHVAVELVREETVPATPSCHVVDARHVPPRQRPVRRLRRRHVVDRRLQRRLVGEDATRLRRRPHADEDGELELAARGQRRNGDAKLLPLRADPRETETVHAARGEPGRAGPRRPRGARTRRRRRGAPPTQVATCARWRRTRRCGMPRWLTQARPDLPSRGTGRPLRDRKSTGSRFWDRRLSWNAKFAPRCCARRPARRRSSSPG